MPTAPINTRATIAMLTVGTPPTAADACAEAIAKHGGSVKWVDVNEVPTAWQDIDAVVIPPGIEADNATAPTLEAIKGAIAQGLPVRGIAEGNLLLNAAAGGTNAPIDAEAQGSMPVDHAEPHWVLALEGSRVSKILGLHMRAPSNHTAAVEAVAPGFMVVLRAADNTTEAIENINNTKVLGVQFDPATVEGGGSFRFFQTLVEDADAHYSKTHRPAQPAPASAQSTPAASTAPTTASSAPSNVSYSNVPVGQRHMTREEQEEFDRKNAEMAQIFADANYF
jgi:GMP synthase-like glutamine amidotransferase